MPDLKSFDVAAPISEVAEFMASEDFKLRMKEHVTGIVMCKTSALPGGGFNAWVGVVGEGTDVSLRAESIDANTTRLTLWFGLKTVIIVTIIMLPLCGLGLLYGALTYFKKKSRSNSLGSRLGFVLTGRFALAAAPAL